MRKPSLLLSALAGALAIAAPLAANAAGDVIKIGFINTTTTPGAIFGKDVQDAVNLSLEHIGGTIAGKKVEVIFEDDGMKPDMGRQKAEKLLQQDKVDLVGGFLWTNVLQAAQKPIFDAGKILVSTNAGPSQLAGKNCNANFFATRAQNDQVTSAVGVVLNKHGIKKLYTIAPNYAGGKEQVNGVLGSFKGEVVGSDYTKWGTDTQMDFSAELAKLKASGAQAVFAFMPGPTGAAFIKQFTQAGLAGTIKLYTAFTVDQLSLPIFQAAGVRTVIGSQLANFWSPDLDNPANKKFVADFQAKYGRLPSSYAAAAYDFLPFVKAGVEQSGGDIANTAAVSAALRKASFDSVRGAYKIANNGFPIDRFYAQTVVDGPIWTTKTDEIIMQDEPDPYAKDCAL
jgi:branched-chain amino acid transport system substrate-binding protein